MRAWSILAASVIAGCASCDKPRGSSENLPGTWAEMPPLPGGARQETAVVAIGSKVYVLGGFQSGGVIVPAMEVWDASTQTWTTAADFPVAMHHANAAVVGGKIYVTGFLTGGGFAHDGRVFVYDPATDLWSERPPMPMGTERGGGGAAAIDSTIYVAGGLRGLTPVTDFWAYDVSVGTAGTWTQLADLPAPRDHLAVAAIGGRVLIAGGRAGAIGAHTSETWSYDPQADAWTARAPMPTSRGGVAAAVLTSSLYLFGGEGNGADPSGVFPQSERYDPATDTWTRLAPMRTPRHGTGAAAVGGRIVVPGGADTQAFGATAVVESFMVD